eukprot:Amastigsp_a345733_3.p3 type:complete len:117 gc:universal Amastigsp_a345733_3:90-440(+)
MGRMLGKTVPRGVHARRGPCGRRRRPSARRRCVCCVQWASWVSRRRDSAARVDPGLAARLLRSEQRARAVPAPLRTTATGPGCVCRRAARVDASRSKVARRSALGSHAPGAKDPCT